MYCAVVFLVAVIALLLVRGKICSDHCMAVTLFVRVVKKPEFFIKKKNSSPGSIFKKV